MNKLFIIIGLVFSLNLVAEDTAPKHSRQEKKEVKVEKCDCQCHKDLNKHSRPEKGKRPSGPPPHRGPKLDGSIR